jgi:signal peptidase I
MRNLEFNKYTGSYLFYNEEEDVKELVKPRNGDIIKFNDDFSYKWIYGNELNTIYTSGQSNYLGNVVSYNDLPTTDIIERMMQLSYSQSSGLIYNRPIYTSSDFDWELEFPRTIRESYRVEEVNSSENSSHTSHTAFDVAEFNEMNRLYEQELRNNE